MINILYTVNGVRINGMSSVLMQYITGLDKTEYRITLFTDEISPQYLKELKQNEVNIVNSTSRKKNQIAYYNELVSVIKRNNIDIIHAHGNSATLAVEMFAARNCGVTVRIAHSHNTTCIHKYFDKLLRPLFYNTYTHGIGCGIQAGKWLFGKRPHIVIKNGIDLEHFQYDICGRNKIRNELGIDSKFVIGHVGRFTDQKNHRFIIDVFEAYLELNSEAVLILVGDGPLEDEIRVLIKEKKLTGQVKFYGTTTDTSPIYSAMDCFVFPSKFEGVPLTLVEAQANGLPCLISDKVSNEVNLTSLIKDLPIDDAKRWAKEINTLKIEEREKTSQDAIDSLTNEGFDRVKVIKQLDKFYKQALEKNQI